MALGYKTGGRQKGTPNKTTALLKDAILQAAILAGDRDDDTDGLVNYLEMQARTNPGPFMALLGKVLPIQAHIGGDPENNTPIGVRWMNSPDEKL
jgi:hypothetical protein